jgi:hypothetical protein
MTPSPQELQEDAILPSHFTKSLSFRQVIFLSPSHFTKPFWKYTTIEVTPAASQAA